MWARQRTDPRQASRLVVLGVHVPMPLVACGLCILPPQSPTESRLDRPCCLRHTSVACLGRLLKQHA